MLSEYSFLLLALCLSLTSSLRPILTLYIVAWIASQKFIDGFILPSYMDILTNSIVLMVLLVLAIVELLGDKVNIYIDSALSFLRPIASILIPLAIMRFGNMYTNMMASILLGICISLPLTRLYSTIVVPARFQKGYNNSAHRNTKDREHTIKIANTISMSFIQDIACAICAIGSFYSAGIVLILQIGAIVAMIAYHQNLQRKMLDPIIPKHIEYAVKKQTFPTFSKHILKSGKAVSMPSSTDNYNTTAIDKDNDDNGYGYAK